MLIGITGKAGSGKDTFADYVLEALPYEHQRYAMADPIKRFVHKVFQGELPPDSRDNKEKPQWFIFKAGDIIDETAKLEENRKASLGLKLIDILRQNGPLETPMGYYRWYGSWRALYQIVGTDWGNTLIHPHVWIRKAPFANAVITDIRGRGDLEDKNVEAKHVLNSQGVVLEVVSNRDYKVREHHSEVGVDPEFITETIENFGTLDDLKQKAVDIVSKLCAN